MATTATLLPKKQPKVAHLRVLSHQLIQVDACLVLVACSSPTIMPKEQVSTAKFADSRAGQTHCATYVYAPVMLCDFAKTSTNLPSYTEKIKTLVRKTRKLKTTVGVHRLILPVGRRPIFFIYRWASGATIQIALISMNAWGKYPSSSTALYRRIFIHQSGKPLVTMDADVGKSNTLRIT